MKERKRRQSLSGAVLVMILTVMFVLIILLTATLTTVTTANQRIYTKFEENQAYYTARSALDVFTRNMMSDGKYIAQSSGNRQYQYGDSKSANMKQGLGIQLDLYSITAQSGYNIKQSDLTSYANTVHNDAAIASADKKDEYMYYFGVEPSGTAVNEIIYDVVFPTVSNGSNAYGKLSDSSTAKIKVEVLDRKYDVGEYTNASGTQPPPQKAQLDDFFNKTGSYSTVTDAMIAEAVANGIRQNDTMCVQITATTEYSGVEGVAVLILNSSEPPESPGQDGFNPKGGSSSDNMNIVSKVATEGDVNWGTNDGFIYGPVYVEGDFIMGSNGPKVHLNSGENFFVGGDMQLANSGHFQVTNDTSPLKVDDKEAPVVFVGGEIKIASDIDNPFLNVDVVAETVTAGAKTTFDSTSKVYCKSFTSHCGSNSQYNGDIYVDGDVTIFSDNDTKITYDGDGNPTVVHGGTGTIHFTGKIIDGSNGMDVTPAAGAGFVQETTHFWSDIPEVSEITDPKRDTSGGDGAKIEFQLPGRTNNKQLETNVDNFDTYYVKDEDGNVVIDPSTNLPEIKSAQVSADIDTMGDKTKPFTSANTGITDKLSTMTTSGGNIYGTQFNHVLDTGGGDVKAVWDFDNQNIYIKGGGTVILQLDETRNWGYGNNNLILVDDDTTLKIVGDVDSVGAGSNTFAKLEVYNQTTYGAAKGIDAGKGTDRLKVGNKSGFGIKVPKIYYYFTGSTFSVQNDCRLTGYVYAPDTIISIPSAGTMVSSMEYNGVLISGAPICAAGAFFSAGASMPNNTGLGGISNGLDDYTPGEPILRWQPYQYIRG